MRKSKFTETQIVGILKDAESGVPVPDLLRKYGGSKATFFKWRGKYGGASVTSLSLRGWARITPNRDLRLVDLSGLAWPR